MKRFLVIFFLVLFPTLVLNAQDPITVAPTSRQDTVLTDLLTAANESISDTNAILTARNADLVARWTADNLVRAENDPPIPPLPPVVEEPMIRALTAADFRRSLVRGYLRSLVDAELASEASALRDEFVRDPAKRQAIRDAQDGR